jgi:Lar family restriction alleviation protein
MPERPENEPMWTRRSLHLAEGVELRPCPFCSATKLALYEYTYAKLFAVDCKVCGAQGPRHSSPRQAQSRWNKRAPDSSSG